MEGEYGLNRYPVGCPIVEGDPNVLPPPDVRLPKPDVD
jgi:hypothetical protein